VTCAPEIKQTIGMTICEFVCCCDSLNFSYVVTKYYFKSFHSIIYIINKTYILICLFFIGTFTNFVELSKITMFTQLTYLCYCHAGFKEKQMQDSI